MNARRTLATWGIILLTVLSMPVCAQFSGSGSGSSTDPFIITSGDELNQVRNFLNNANVNFKMLNDVDLTQWLAENNPTQGWAPMGNSSSNAFSGNFNGNNCKIIGLSINRPTTDYVGLFGFIANANIYNLTLAQCEVKGRDYSSIFSGYVVGQTTIKNITIQGNVTGNNYSGILMGYNTGSGKPIIQNINIQGDIHGVDNVGIMAGYIEVKYWEGGFIVVSTTHLYTLDNIKANGNSFGTSNIGGLVGRVSCSIYNLNNDNFGTISFSNISISGNITGVANTGGIVGNINSNSDGGLRYTADAKIYYSKLFFIGKVIGQNKTGGLFGTITQNSSGKSTNIEKLRIENSGFVGEVSGLNNTGGLIGYVNGTYRNMIDRCYSTGNVKGLAGCGGILGESGSSISITNCHSHCDISGTTSVGGIAGKSLNPYIVKNYSDGNVRGTSNVGGILGESVSGGSNTIQSNASINNVISGNGSVGRITGLFKVTEILTSAQSNYGWALTKVIVNNINATVVDSYQHGITYGLSQFKKKATYQGIGWDFTTANYWNIVENQSYPYFTWQTPPAVITTSPIKAGTTTISGTSVANATLNITVGAKEYTTTANSLNWSIEVDPLLSGDTISVIAKQGILYWSYHIRGIVELKGSGTISDPYQIYNATDLNAINNNMSANYKLMNDIDLSSWILSTSSTTGWKSIGIISGGLTGTFNGDNHKITGFWQSSSQTSSGLFTAIGTSGEIRNLIIEPSAGKNISGLDYTAILTGRNYGIIENCKASGTVQGYNVGCIAGFNSGTIKNCIGSGLITSIVSSGKAGGIAGDNVGIISNCEYTGDITCNVGSGYLGGITGSSTNSVVNCYYSGTLSSSIATAHIGGIVGLNSGLISTSYSLGTINATGATAYAGGIAGDNNSTTSEINNSESGMNINSTGASTVCGGVVGITKGKVTNCYATGNIASGYRGSGVVGYMDGTGAKVLGCVGLNTNISGKNSVCRVLGGVMNSATAPSNTDNYGCKDMLITINGVVQSTLADNYLQGTAKDRVDLKKQSFFEGIGWNFVSIWYINEGIDYPYLRFLLKPVTGVTLNKSNTTLIGGAIERLTVTVTPTNATNKNVTWTSSDLTVASVDATGKVTALSAGKVTITATTNDQGKTAQCIVTVVLLPATAGTITGATTVCRGQSSVNYTVSAISNATSYIWTLPGGATGTSTTNSIYVVYGSAAESGNITVKGINAIGDGVASTLAITVNPLPGNAGTIVGTSAVCQGQNTVSYTLPAITNATSYIWTLPTGATGISTTNSISVNYGATAVSGNITVKGHNACGDGVVSTLAITVNPLPGNAGTITGTAAVCQGGQNAVSYTLPSIANATSYIWTLPTGAIGIITKNSISVIYGTTAVSGNITVKGHNACGDGVASTLLITVNPLPQKPVITKNGDVLHSTSTTGNQWYSKNGLIAGANSQDYTPKTSGDYYVVVSNIGCNSEPSNSIHLIPTGINPILSAKTIKVYPNPVTNELTIEIDGNTKNSEFEILNSIGQVVFTGALVEKTVVQTSNFLPGFYLVKLKFGQTFEFKKVIKQ